MRLHLGLCIVDPTNHHPAAAPFTFTVTVTAHYVNGIATTTEVAAAFGALACDSGTVSGASASCSNATGTGVYGSNIVYNPTASATVVAGGFNASVSYLWYLQGVAGINGSNAPTCTGILN